MEILAIKYWKASDYAYASQMYELKRINEKLKWEEVRFRRSSAGEYFNLGISEEYKPRGVRTIPFEESHLLLPIMKL